MEAVLEKEAPKGRKECEVATVALMHSDDTHENLKKHWKGAEMYFSLMIRQSFASGPICVCLQT